MKQFFGDVRSLLFVPYALADYDGYEKLVREAFAPVGIEVHSIHRESQPIGAVGVADGIFVGGGNTFRLLKALYRQELLDPIRSRVRSRETAYMGSSAGTNLACPTIRTTNDMPIVEPPSLNALGLIPFQINPHFLDPDPSSTHQGETREQRLNEYLEENTMPVLGLREGCWLDVDGAACTLRGARSARLFMRGAEPREIEPDGDLSELLA